jgi:hypothetical protein
MSIEVRSLWVSDQIMVPIFAHQRTRNASSNCSVVLSHSRDIDEKPGIGVDPPAVYDVEHVSSTTASTVRVDLEQIISSYLDLWQTEMMLRHVVVLGEIGYSRLGDLHIKIRVPG